MASTHDELMKTTGSLCKWLTEQKSTLDDKVFQEVLETQHKTVCEQIRAIGSITPEQATGFSNAFNTGPWSSAQKESITKLISNLMASPTTRRTRRENQDVQTFAHYFSRKDHEVLADESKSDHDKIDTIANRLVKLHLWLPSEQAVRAVMQAAVASGFTHAEEHRIGIVRAIKAAVKQRTKSMPRTLQLPTPMPSNPKDLPGDIFAQACPEGDPPVSLEEGKCLAVQMFVRNSHSSSSGAGSSQALMLASTGRRSNMRQEDILQIARAVSVMQQRKERGRSRQFEDDEPELPGFKLLGKRARGSPSAPSAPPAAAEPTQQEEDTQDSAASLMAKPTSKPDPAPAKAEKLFVPPPIDNKYAIEDKKEAPSDDPEKIAQVYEEAAVLRKPSTNTKAKAKAKPQAKAATAKAKPRPRPRPRPRPPRPRPPRPRPRPRRKPKPLTGSPIGRMRKADGESKLAIGQTVKPTVTITVRRAAALGSEVKPSLMGIRTEQLHA